MRRFADARDTLEAAVLNRDGPLLAKLRATRDAGSKDVGRVAAGCVADSSRVWLDVMTEGGGKLYSMHLDQCGARR